MDISEAVVCYYVLMKAKLQEEGEYRPVFTEYTLGNSELLLCRPTNVMNPPAPPLAAHYMGPRAELCTYSGARRTNQCKRASCVAIAVAKIGRTMALMERHGSLMPHYYPAPFIFPALSRQYGRTRSSSCQMRYAVTVVCIVGRHIAQFPLRIL